MTEIREGKTGVVLMTAKPCRREAVASEHLADRPVVEDSCLFWYAF
jgi:hypothetical protein